MYVITMCKCLLMVTLFMAFLMTGWAHAEYCRYVDRDGTTHFVDDCSKIPKEYWKNEQVRKDRYDDLSEEDQALMREKELLENQAARAREEALAAQRIRERDERERKAAHARKLAEMTTKVQISGNQVFVPVTLANGSMKTQVMLLLDTGATSTVISPEVAERLNIEQYDYIKVGVVGGKVLKARRTNLDHMQVGPVKKTNQQVIIVRRGAGQQGDGLLGMSFMGGLKYFVDFEKQVINWIP